MSDNTHTPGPWKVAQLQDKVTKENSISVITSESEEDISRIICDISPVKRLDEQDIFNANLIGSAPEMLEALKVIISIVNSEEAIIRILGEWQTEHGDVIEYIETVIAKAEGKEDSSE